MYSAMLLLFTNDFIFVFSTAFVPVAFLISQISSYQFLTQCYMYSVKKINLSKLSNAVLKVNKFVPVATPMVRIPRFRIDDAHLK